MNYDKAMKKNDEKVAKQIAEYRDVTVACDDGNVHVQCKNKNTADEIQEHFGSKVTSDGVQEGAVQIWMGDALVHDNL